MKKKSSKNINTNNNNIMTCKSSKNNKKSNISITISNFDSSSSFKKSNDPLARSQSNDVNSLSSPIKRIRSKSVHETINSKKEETSKSNQLSNEETDKISSGAINQMMDVIDFNFDMDDRINTEKIQNQNENSFSISPDNEIIEKLRMSFYPDKKYKLVNRFLSLNIDDSKYQNNIQYYKYIAKFKLFHLTQFSPGIYSSISFSNTVKSLIWNFFSESVREKCSDLNNNNFIYNINEREKYSDGNKNTKFTTNRTSLIVTNQELSQIKEDEDNSTLRDGVKFINSFLNESNTSNDKDYDNENIVNFCLTNYNYDTIHAIKNKKNNNLINKEKTNELILKKLKQKKEEKEEKKRLKKMKKIQKYQEKAVFDFKSQVDIFRKPYEINKTDDNAYFPNIQFDNKNYNYFLDVIKKEKNDLLKNKVRMILNIIKGDLKFDTSYNELNEMDNSNSIHNNNNNINYTQNEILSNNEKNNLLKYWKTQYKRILDKVNKSNKKRISSYSPFDNYRNSRIKKFPGKSNSSCNANVYLKKNSIISRNKQRSGKNSKCYGQPTFFSGNTRDDFNTTSTSNLLQSKDSLRFNYSNYLFDKNTNISNASNTNNNNNKIRPTNRASQMNLAYKELLSNANISPFKIPNNNSNKKRGSVI